MSKNMQFCYSKCKDSRKRIKCKEESKKIWGEGETTQNLITWEDDLKYQKEKYKRPLNILTKFFTQSDK
jgi:hypothetical protein